MKPIENNQDAADLCRAIADAARLAVAHLRACKDCEPEPCQRGNYLVSKYKRLQERFDTEVLPRVKVTRWDT